MDLRLVNRSLNFTQKRKNWVLLLAALGATGYGVYRVYNLPSIVKKRNKFLKLLGALVSITESISYSTETIGVLSKDLKKFLQSDSDEIPNSLKQISKIALSEEFSDSVVRVTAALTRGVFKGYQVESEDGSSRVESNSDFYDRFMDKLFSNAGSGFASVVVGNFARNLVMAFYSDEKSNVRLNSSTETNVDAPLPRWVDVICSNRFRDLIGGCIQTFVSTAISVFLDKTMNINTYDEFFAGLTNPKHEKEVRDLLVSLCNGSIETLVNTSHQVLTSSNSGSNLGSNSSDISRFVVSKTMETNDMHNAIMVKHNRQSGWVSTMSSTLAIPSNRKLVLDVTGRVTFETVRSFLEFLLEKVKTSLVVVNEAMVERGLQVVRYVTAKSCIVATICLSLCLHVLGGTWVLMPA